MTQIHSYLTFNGNCREAMTFYKNCLGGELTIQTLEDSPMSDQMPSEMRESVLHSSLEKGKLLLMGSDMVPESGRTPGNAVSLILMCTSEEEIRDCFVKLADGGQASNPLEITYWGALFGELTDKYGNNWILNYEKQSS